jgi:hypothetical protein
MDRVPDNGAGWRDRLRPQLLERGIFVLDPTRKPIDIGTESMDQKPYRKMLKAQGRYDEFAEVVKPVRWTDLRMVDLSDFIIVSVDLSVHACGTYEEMDLANRQKKPILVWCQQGKAEAPDWMFAQIPHQHIFGSLDEVLAYLDFYDSAPIASNMKRFYDFNLPEFYNREVLEMILAHLDEVQG